MAIDDGIHFRKVLSKKWEHVPVGVYGEVASSLFIFVEQIELSDLFNIQVCAFAISIPDQGHVGPIRGCKLYVNAHGTERLYRYNCQPLGPSPGV